MAARRLVSVWATTFVTGSLFVPANPSFGGPDKTLSNKRLAPLLFARRRRDIQGQKRAKS